MKNRLILLFLTIFSLNQTIFAAAGFQNEPDSVYIFAFTVGKNAGNDGLHFAWSTDRQNWTLVDHNFLRCDYGRWGSEKKMFSPYLFRDAVGLWHCVWTLNDKVGAFAHAASEDLVNWQRQSYPVVVTNKNCLQLEVSYNKTNAQYSVSWLSKKDSAYQAYSVTTKDFKNYALAKSIPETNRLNRRENITISNNLETGTVHKVPRKVVDELINIQQTTANKYSLTCEVIKDDSSRFAGLQPLNATITVKTLQGKKISDLLVGVFFEDISYAADGGLYAELIQNRGFEYSPSDKEGRDKTWNNTKAWSINDSNSTFAIDTILPIHLNNKHYAVLNVSKTGTGLINEGFEGIPINEGDLYDFSLFVRNPDKKNKKLLIRLIGQNGEIYSESAINVNFSEWKKVEAVLSATKTVPDARLEIVSQNEGQIALDMISLFPRKTFREHKNGLRADLAQTIANIHPRFIRFPGGCVAHGDGLGNIYRWKNTIGPLEARKPQRNIWGYHQTAGLGYFEYFQFCEDIGAEPLPVIAAGVPCQNSVGGQQGGIPMSDMSNYVQDILDLIEWANGDIKTFWGKKRAEAGHPKSFNLKYLGIGNEDLITDIFEERFTMIYKALKEKHPEITVVGTVGPFCEGTDYVEGWKIAEKLKLPMVDEHYYQSPGWFINNQDFYDKYDRSKSKVYLGEYAAHLPGRPNNIETALAEALYLTTLERNGDVVSMASYAPMLAKEKHTQWSPDLIYFSNTEVKPTVGYYVQQLYGQNSGNTYLPNEIVLSDNKETVRKRVAASVVRDSKSNDLIIKLVNILPVIINTKVKLDGVNTVDPLAVQTLLSGNPTDRNAQPSTTDIKVSADFSCTLPAYSFMVIRIKEGK